MQWPHVRLNPDSNPAANGMEGFYTWALADEFRQSWRPPRPDENFGSTVSENVRVVQASEKCDIHTTVGAALIPN